jgi:hypothetical protein
VQNQEKSIDARQSRASLRSKLKAQMWGFKSHPLVEEWRQQYAPENLGQQLRYKMLLLLGQSRMGKTQFAKSLFVEEHTLVVNCQMLG